MELDDFNTAVQGGHEDTVILDDTEPNMPVKYFEDKLSFQPMLGLD